MTYDWKRAVFYEIFPDRFARSERVEKVGVFEEWDSPPSVYGFKGGDLYGVVEHLDYLRDLGINAIYLTPVFTSTANHRYHTTDYFNVDPILGGMPAFDALIKSAHERDMRIIIDGVFNHASRSFLQFAHTAENGSASPYIDWFHFDQSALKDGGGIVPYGRMRGNSDIQKFGYRCWWGLPALPKFNTYNPEVIEFALKVARFWTERGIDGWRFDVPEEIENPDFWPLFCAQVREVNPSCYLTGEIWENGSSWVTENLFDSIMNYELAKKIIGFTVDESPAKSVVQNSNYRDIQPLDAESVADWIDSYFKLFDSESLLRQLNLLGSHDTPRTFTILRQNPRKHLFAHALIYLLPGLPCVYYGDEIGLTGGKDPHCRKTIPSEIFNNAFENSIYKGLSDLASLRKEHSVLRDGKYRRAIAKGDIFSFYRQDSETCFLCIFNKSRFGTAFKYPDEFQPSRLIYPAGGDLHDMLLAPHSFRIISGKTLQRF
ncbi:glycoside hydrolase family 13 protein [Myxococcota bacterium]|nr:glycoside hydrolase family 13 protein [Myxococcota bacterium]MBU1381628.1 glycoside hydrolase family 13 protein [Myxococcota bacterium]MBU1496828.1 glycoside hydrolase family 13 protein [Myxococcota bacterium]